MLGKFFAWLFGRPRTSSPKLINLTRDQIGSPISLKRDADLRGEPAESARDVIPTPELIATCERYWRSLNQTPESIESAFTLEATDCYNDYVRAVNALGARGPAVRDWARRLLVHPEYMARETGAWLLGELGERGELGGVVGTIVSELEALINRPFEEDPPKEAVAIDQAIGALAKIGHPKGVKVLRQVLFSIRKEHEGDTQREAISALEKLVGESFAESGDPVEAARSWLRAHPNK